MFGLFSLAVCFWKLIAGVELTPKIVDLIRIDVAIRYGYKLMYEQKSEFTDLMLEAKKTI